ncbi:MAG: hypothetical protein GXO35_05915, partial [Gammaproteobacteria bacterium]|nr:hypothetical protein [Gammaproteobacteria bacterium]
GLGIALNVVKQYGEQTTQDNLLKAYLKNAAEHFGAIAAPKGLVPFTGALNIDRYLLWPELDERKLENIRADEDKQVELNETPKRYPARDLLIRPLSERLFAVEGEAGVGKTTMAHAIMHFAAAESLKLLGGEDSELAVLYLPLYFNADDLIKLAEDAPLGSVEIPNAGVLDGLLGSLVRKAEGAPNRALLVIVDGLDEVGEPVQTKALQRLRGLWTEEGNHRYLVLGRPGSVRGIPWVQGDEGVLKLALRPWDKAEVVTFIERWSVTNDDKNLLLTNEEMEKLIDYFASYIGLPTTALMVQMVIARYLVLRRRYPEDPVAHMPQTRSKLYQNYLRQLLEFGENAKPKSNKGGTALDVDPQTRTWLGCLELLLKQNDYLHKTVRATCSSDELPDVAREAIFGHSCVSLTDGISGAEKWWEERKLCRLGHESLHEFLAAEALAKLYNNKPEAFWEDWIHPYIFNMQWQQTLLFALTLIQKERQVSLIRNLLQLGESDPISINTKRHLEVVAKAWGWGASYEPQLWQDWLNQNPSIELLTIVAVNAELRNLAISILEKLALGEVQ